MGLIRYSMLEYLYEKVIYISIGFTANTDKYIFATTVLAYWYIVYNYGMIVYT